MQKNDIITLEKPDFSFPKAEHLKSERIISVLFKGKASSIGAYPLRAVWQEVDFFYDTQNPTIHCQVAVTAPKKTFKRAHDRNRYKRLIREAYRLNKHEWLPFLQENKKKIALMIIFTGKEATDFDTINHKIKKMFTKMIREIGT
ncbi:MAG: ribonuclease protein component [Bacteroidota bacterium]|jgi:ribonuclease P protein component